MRSNNSASQRNIGSSRISSGDRYGSDVLAHDPHRANSPAESTPVVARVGIVVEDVTSGFVGEIVSVGKIAGVWCVTLEDRHRARRTFRVGRGYWIDGKPVSLTAPVAADRPQPATVAGHTLTASGSLHVNARARVARASRIWVEGKHDAELVAKVWGEDLAREGVVVEELLGVDHLEERIAQFTPTPERRAGVLIDHLVPGSKESRIAARMSNVPGVLILGHPYVDVWQAIKPTSLGITAWPDVPKGEDIKAGTLKRLGWPYSSAEDIGRAWAHILSRVHSYKDLEPSLLGRMEELIDFVTATEN
ncbi:MAG: DUF3097 domain-containing protein [Ancrocorticia sp.]|nr:DUF3097 domain-containing protein [Ancrocorticia sp.]MCI1895510.1 DUF3097 domain-containing protein [Ancrocorticia sp.]MCI1932183.1 DUF3097 domain-containing protein [Ancrocorticia sp.]MCI1963543.1 DUF3097 domain-containing protein [Ancrocorticia sp.]MCI2002706.1 DUF3097 domain-containing protein [Ancrocorticia sp.]